MQSRTVNKIQFSYSNRQITIFFDSAVFDLMNPDMSDSQKQKYFEQIGRSLVLNARDPLDMKHSYLGNELTFYIDRVIHTAKPPASHTLTIANALAEGGPLELAIDENVGSDILIEKFEETILPNSWNTMYAILAGYRKSLEKKNAQAFRAGKKAGTVPELPFPQLVQYSEEDFNSGKAKTLFDVPQYYQMTVHVTTARNALAQFHKEHAQYTLDMLLSSYSEQTDAYDTQQLRSAILTMPAADEYKSLHNQLAHKASVFAAGLNGYDSREPLKEYYIDYRNREAKVNYPKQLVAYALKKAALEYYSILGNEVRSESKQLDFNQKFAQIAQISASGSLTFCPEVDAADFVTLQKIASDALSKCTAEKTLRSRSLNFLKQNLEKVNRAVTAQTKKTLFAFTNTSFSWNQDLRLPDSEQSLKTDLARRKKSLANFLDQCFAKDSIGNQVERFSLVDTEAMKTEFSKLKKLAEEQKQILIARKKGQTLLSQLGQLFTQMAKTRVEYQPINHQYEGSEKEIYSIMLSIQEYLQELMKSKMLPTIARLEKASTEKDAEAILSELREYSAAIQQRYAIFANCVEAILQEQKMRANKQSILNLYKSTNELPRIVESILNEANQLLQASQLVQTNLVAAKKELQEGLSLNSFVEAFASKLETQLKTAQKNLKCAEMKISLVSNLQVMKKDKGLPLLSLYRDLQLNASIYRNEEASRRLEVVNNLLEQLNNLTTKTDQMHIESQIQNLIGKIEIELIAAKEQTINLHQHERKLENFRTPSIQKLMEVYFIILKMIQDPCWEKKESSPTLFSSKEHSPKIRVKERIGRMRLKINECQDKDSLKCAQALLNDILEIAKDKKSLSTNELTKQFYQFLIDNIPLLLKGLSGQCESMEKFNPADTVFHNAQIVAKLHGKMKVDELTHPFDEIHSTSNVNRYSSSTILN